MGSPKGTPHLSDAHLGYQTSHPANDDVINLVLDQVRLADRDGCPHYHACLDKASRVVPGQKSRRSVCEGCNGTPRLTLDELVAECSAKYNICIAAIRQQARANGACEARREIWERGNLLGYSDAELARATGVTRQSVAYWLDQPRRRA